MKATNKIRDIAFHILGDFPGKDVPSHTKLTKTAANEYHSDQWYLANLGEPDLGSTSEQNTRMDGVEGYKNKCLGPGKMAKLRQNVI